MRARCARVRTNNNMFCIIHKKSPDVKYKIKKEQKNLLNTSCFILLGDYRIIISCVRAFANEVGALFAERLRFMLLYKMV